jgi:hypothetical protein
MSSEHFNPDRFADSAGIPWAGRSFDANQNQNDDGRAPEHLLQALKDFANQTISAEKVVDALRGSRLLIPLVANLGESGEDPHGRTVDKSAELSIITVSTPDNQVALPAFTSVMAMQAWNPKARPVPNQARVVALAAASENSTRLVIDATSEHEFVLRRPAIAALAQDLPWQSAETNLLVRNAVDQAIDSIEHIERFTLLSGDQLSRLAGPELVVVLYLAPGLSSAELESIEGQIFERLANATEFVAAVDSMAIKFLAAD